MSESNGAPIQPEQEPRPTNSPAKPAEKANPQIVAAIISAAGTLLVVISREGRRKSKLAHRLERLITGISEQQIVCTVYIRKHPDHCPWLVD